MTRTYSRFELAICETNLVHTEGAQEYSETPQIKAKMKFDSFDELKFFFADYAVRMHRPFTIYHSDKN